MPSSPGSVAVLRINNSFVRSAAILSPVTGSGRW